MMWLPDGLSCLSRAIPRLPEPSVSIFSGFSRLPSCDRTVLASPQNFSALNVAGACLGRQKGSFVESAVRVHRKHLPQPDGGSHFPQSGQ